MKKITAVILSVIIALSCMSLLGVCSFADDAFTVTVSGGAESADALNAVDWFKTESGEYFFFIPSCWDASEINVWASSAASLNGTEIVNGEAYDLGESGTITAGGASYHYNVLSSSGIGTVFITTESGSLEAVHADKNHKEPGKISILNAKGKEQTENDTLEYIKGRGNASWEGAKKPYNIKLDKKAKILGMQKSKKWCLIANEDDRTLARNAAVYTAAAEAGLAYSPENAPVDLYINNEYQGSYLLTSKVEAASARIDVENLDDINEEACIEKFGEDFDMDTLPVGGTYGTFAGLLEGTQKYVEFEGSENVTTDGGYILEMEIANRYIGDLTGFVSNDGQPFVMKCPEYATEKQIKFISDYYQRFEDAVLSESGKNSKGEDYKDLIDIESFAKYYVISEWTSNMDSGLTSTYLYLDTTKDGKLYAGPVWDYDIALGNNGEGRYGLDYRVPDKFTVCFGRQYRNTVFGRADIDEKPTIFNLLCQKKEFIEECEKVWNASVGEVLTSWSNEKIAGYAGTIADSAIMNHIRWNTFGISDVSEVKKAYDGQVNGLLEFAKARAGFLGGNIGAERVNEAETNAVLKFLKKIPAGLNNLIEKAIVLFKLENKVF